MSTSTQGTYNMVYLVYFFTVMKKSIDLKLQKICIKAFYIVCSLRRTTNLKSNTIGFFIL
jgi:hypothetical protein